MSGQRDKTDLNWTTTKRIGIFAIFHWQRSANLVVCAPAFEVARVFGVALPIVYIDVRETA